LTRAWEGWRRSTVRREIGGVHFAREKGRSTQIALRFGDKVIQIRQGIPKRQPVVLTRFLVRNSASSTVTPLGMPSPMPKQSRLSAMRKPESLPGTQRERCILDFPRISTSCVTQHQPRRS
jgi:hypothetical protein